MALYLALGWLVVLVLATNAGIQLLTASELTVVFADALVGWVFVLPPLQPLADRRLARARLYRRPV